MRRKARAVVLLSGGLDSTVALWWAVRRGWDAFPLTFRYPSRPVREARAALRVARLAGVRRPVAVGLDFLRTPAGLMPPGAPEGYIPARNLVFYSFAAHYAGTIGAHYIVGGHTAADGEEFPDATGRFFAAFNRVCGVDIRNRGRSPVEVVLPFARLKKADVVRLGAGMGAPIGATWSCHRRGARPCGRCAACRGRGGRRWRRSMALGTAGGISPPNPGRHRINESSHRKLYMLHSHI